MSALCSSGCRRSTSKESFCTHSHSGPNDASHKQKVVHGTMLRRKRFLEIRLRTRWHNQSYQIQYDVFVHWGITSTTTPYCRTSVLSYCHTLTLTLYWCFQVKSECQVQVTHETSGSTTSSEIDLVTISVYVRFVFEMYTWMYVLYIFSV